MDRKRDDVDCFDWRDSRRGEREGRKQRCERVFFRRWRDDVKRESVTQSNGIRCSDFFQPGDAYANGVEKAIDNEVRDTGNTADYLVQKGVRIWEGGTVQKYKRKLVELCDISKWW